MTHRRLILLAITAAAAATLLSWPRTGGRGDRAPRSYATRAAVEREGPSSYPSDWAWLRRTAPVWQADPDAFREAVAEARALRAASASGFRIQLSPVTPAGPDNIGGRISDIEWDPADPNVAYAGAATGGVFKSTNGGLAWTPIADDLPNLNVGDLAVDPTNTQIVWLGTGEANGGHNNFPGGGVYKSVDGGNTWTFMGLGETVSIGRILVDPTDGQRVFVAAQGSYFGPNPERGIYRTTDGGASWQRVLFVSDSTAATDLVMDPGAPDRLMAAMWERVRRPNGGTHLNGPTSRIWRSLDGGDTWTVFGAANGLPTTNIGRIGLALCPVNPDIAYALINNGSVPIGLWRTLDFGTSWTNRDTDNEIQNPYGFSWYFGQVRVAPDNCNRVYALDVSFYRSDDGGATFPIKYGYSGSPAGFHVDHHALAFDPTNPDRLLEGNDGGINRSSNRGTSWEKVYGLPVNQFYEIGLALLAPARLYGGTQDNGTLGTTTGAVNGWTDIYGGDGFYVNVDPRDNDVIYAESQYGDLGKSINGGVSWTPVAPGAAAGDRKNWSTPVKLDPVNPDIVYYGTQRIWRSDNGGGSWSAVSGDLTGWVPGAVLGTITTIGVSPADHDVVWAGTDDGNVWRGVRGGGGIFTWSNATRPNLPDRWVTRVVAHPTDPLAAWATFNGLKWIEPEGHVFATTDGGVTWTDITSNLPDAPVNAFAVDPANADVLFVGSDLGAYYSDNGGAIWNYLSPELPLVSVYDLAIHPGARYLAIGTHGRSMYRMNLTALLAAGDRATVEDPERLANAPNPFRDATRIRFTLARAGRVRLEVFDVTGRRVRTLADEARAAGRHELGWDGRGDDGRMLPAGSYRARLVTPDGARVTRAITRIR